MNRHRTSIVLFLLLFPSVVCVALDGDFYVEDTIIRVGPNGEKVAEKVQRPMKSDEFERYIKEKFLNGTVSVGDLEELGEAWKSACKSWNAKNPDSQIDYDDDDFGYGDDDTGEPEDDDYEYIPNENDIRNLLDGKEPVPKEGDRVLDGSVYDPQSVDRAINADADDETTTRGLTDTAELEGADGEYRSYSFNITDGGVKSNSKSIAGLFGGLGMLPFVNETDEEAKKMIGYVESKTITDIIVYEHHESTWAYGRGYMGGSFWGWKTKTTTIQENHKGIIEEEFDEPDNPPDWGALEVPENYLDEADYSSFNWDFGGFRGGDAVSFSSKAEAVGGPVIGDLKIGKEGLSFHYEEGLSSWGLEDTDASALACLFVLDNDGNWVGGKFDWISTSRHSRSFENVYSGYNGWDLSNVPKTTTAAFVIVSKDGKKRSNVITAQWER